PINSINLVIRRFKSAIGHGRRPKPKDHLQYHESRMYRFDHETRPLLYDLRRLFRNFITVDMNLPNALAERLSESGRVNYLFKRRLLPAARGLINQIIRLGKKMDTNSASKLKEAA